jgi:transcriptional regulator with XRE-family HTH domain
MGKQRRPGEHGTTYVLEWREHRGLSQEELGEKIGKGKAAVSKIENSKTGILLENLELIAKALDCTVLDLLARPPQQHADLFVNYARATDAQRKQFDRLSRAIIDPDET